MEIVSLHYGTTKEDFTIYHFDCNQKELFVKPKEKKRKFSAWTEIQNASFHRDIMA